VRLCGGVQPVRVVPAGIGEPALELREPLGDEHAAERLRGGPRLRVGEVGANTEPAADGAPRALLAVRLRPLDPAVLLELAQVEGAARDRLARALGALSGGELDARPEEIEQPEPQRVGHRLDRLGLRDDDVAGRRRAGEPRGLRRLLVGHTGSLER
jgi:hypothetical protein